MVEARLESVVTRLEALAATITGEPAKAAPAKVAAVSAGAASGNDLSGAFAKAVSHHYAELEATSQPHVECVKTVTGMLIQACKNQEAVLATMARF